MKMVEQKCKDEEEWRTIERKEKEKKKRKLAQQVTHFVCYKNEVTN